MCALKIGRYSGILQLTVEEGIEGRTLDKNNSAQMRKYLARSENKDPTDRAKALEIEARLWVISNTMQNDWNSKYLQPTRNGKEMALIC